MVCQSSGMCFFFFISGYFTPGSLEKKGVYLFLRDKFLRYGTPLFVYFFLLRPGMTYFNFYALDIIKDDSVSGSFLDLYFPHPGACWFLQVLLILNMGYVVAATAYASVRNSSLPSLTLPIDKSSVRSATQLILFCCALLTAI